MSSPGLGSTANTARVAAHTRARTFANLLFRSGKSKTARLAGWQKLDGQTKSFKMTFLFLFVLCDIVHLIRS
jgi:hypothetical protein